MNSSPALLAPGLTVLKKYYPIGVRLSMKFVTLYPFEKDIINGKRQRPGMVGRQSVPKGYSTKEYHLSGKLRYFKR